LKKDHFIVLTAKVRGRVIGGMTGYILDQYYDTKPLAYIYDLAILVEFQRKGIGRQLIEFFNSYCKNIGIAEVFVQADKADDYAIDFYHSTRPTHEIQVVHFNYTLNQSQK
jgi:aminoglycoside 3-N-acetyltransferase I